MGLATGMMLQDRYRIARQLGQGGMGAVYRAWDTRLNISVAIKEMLSQPGLDAYTLAALRTQFQQEAAILARLNHPNLVRVTDFFEEGGNAYLVMDFMEGESLADRIVQQGRLPEAEVLTWALQLLDALAYCHNQGVIHRDIKPQNVIIRPDGRAVLVDFGLVKLWDPNAPQTKTVMRGMGTPEYAPPEQYSAQSGHTDPRSDLYSLGATLYHALTGRIPPTATHRIVDPNSLVPIAAVIPGVTPRVQQAVMRALELQPSTRFNNAGEMAAALRGSAPLPTAPPVVDRTPTQPPVEAPPVIVPARPATPPQGMQSSVPGTYAQAPARPISGPVAPPDYSKLPGVAAPPAATPKPKKGLPGIIWFLGGGFMMLVLCVGGIFAIARWANSLETPTPTTPPPTRLPTVPPQPTATVPVVRPTSTPRVSATATVAATNALLQAAANWSLVLAEPFDANTNTWPTGAYTDERVDGKREIVNGKYRWTLKAIQDFSWNALPDVAETSDLYATVEGRQISGPRGAKYGVVFRWLDRDNYYVFEIRDDQHYAFYAQEDGTWRAVIDWDAQSSLIQPGRANQITVIAQGDQFTFFINNQFVDEATDTALTSGKTGVVVELPTAGDSGVFEFDNLEVREP